MCVKFIVLIVAWDANESLRVASRTARSVTSTLELCYIYKFIAIIEYSVFIKKHIHTTHVRAARTTTWHWSDVVFDDKRVSANSDVDNHGDDDDDDVDDNASIVLVDAQRRCRNVWCDQ